MMDNLRAASNHVVLKIILGLIIIFFLLSGVSSYQFGGNSDFAADVNGEKISRAQFERVFSGERQRQQQMLGEQFSQLASNPAYMQSLRQQVLSQMVDEKLISQYVKTLGLSVSDDQIAQAIFAEPVFQTDGKFDNAKYQRLINNIGFSTEQYAESLRKQLSAQQLITGLTNTDFMLSDEVAATINLVAQTRTIREATINVSGLTDKQTVSEDEARQYYEKNKLTFLASEQYRVSYIKLDLASLAQTADEAEIEKWYQEHTDDYGQPERHRYSMMQFKTQEDAERTLAELGKGADFATLAKQHSTDPISAPKGGDLGWLEPSTTAEEITQARLKNKGDTSGVIKSSVGFLILRLDDIQPAKVKPLSEVQDTIADKVKQEKALDAYYKLQQGVSEAASNDNTSLESAEKVAGVKAVKTDWFTQSTLPAALNFKPVEQAIFSGRLIGADGSQGNNSEVISVEGDQAFVLRVTDHKPQATKAFNEVEAQITTLLKQQKAKAEAQLLADKLLAELRAGDATEQMKAAKISFGSPVTVNRNSNGQVAQTVFAMSPKEGKTSYTVSDDDAGNLVIIALDKIGVTEIPQEQRQAMVEGMTSSNAQITFAALLSNLKKEAKIKYGPAAVDSQ
ncbi:MAG: Peptidyl-prolyl cis-trans isomerase D [Candidatus Erwinia impunctatus]|nr:Peptidyl-prolyl cis-trans isomerase D [Culicoides impunctatus]